MKMIIECSIEFCSLKFVAQNLVQEVLTETPWPTQPSSFLNILERRNLMITYNYVLTKSYNRLAGMYAYVCACSMIIKNQEN